MNLEEKETSSAWGWITGVVAVLMLYVLSPGPVVMIYRKSGQEPPRAIQIIYAPLEWAYDTLPPVKMAYDAYFKMLSDHP